jgi:hypothetical protein
LRTRRRVKRWPWVKVVGPDKSEQVKDLMGMEGHFGADFLMAKKGKTASGANSSLRGWEG